jgi:uncharacterized protein YqhQ
VGGLYSLCTITIVKPLDSWLLCLLLVSKFVFVKLPSFQVILVNYLYPGSPDRELTYSFWQFLIFMKNLWFLFFKENIEWF